MNKIVREASGVHNYALVPPIRKKNTEEKVEIDPETHPLMKPYREQTNRNPVMVTFGHRPKSASRTFHPGTMRIRLGRGEIADTAAAGGKNGIGLPPSVLSQLLHAPPVPRPGEELQDDEDGGNAANRDLQDPNGLFLPADQLFGDPSLGQSQSRSSTGGLGLGVGERGLGESTYGADGFGETEMGGQNTRELTRQKKQTRREQKKEAVHDQDWNNHFHVMDKLSNEVFELRKSGIAETKLMPLKDRLKRFAPISVREQKPDPFCVEKKATDLLVANGLPAKEMPVNYDKTANPFYDAEVEEDLRAIHRHKEATQEKHERKLRKKLLKAALKSIPHIDYHPDQIVIQRASQSTLPEEGAAPSSTSPPHQLGATLEASTSVATSAGGGGRGGSVTRSSPKTKAKKTKKTTATRSLEPPPMGTVPYEVYMVSPPKPKGEKKRSAKKSPSKKAGSGAGAAGDAVYFHVMQPFDQYLREEMAREEAARKAEEERRMAEERRRWGGGDGEEEDEEVGELDRLGTEFIGGDLGGSSVHQGDPDDPDMLFDEDAELEKAGYGSHSHDDLGEDADIDVDHDGGEYDV